MTVKCNFRLSEPCFLSCKVEVFFSVVGNSVRLLQNNIIISY